MSFPHSRGAGPGVRMVLGALVPSAVPLGAVVNQCGATSAPNNQNVGFLPDLPEICGFLKILPYPVKSYHPVKKMGQSKKFVLKCHRYH